MLQSEEVSKLLEAYASVILTSGFLFGGFKLKILIVDDNADDRKLLRYIIERKGHEDIEAGDGLEGLKMARLQKPDLIISDALMPLMDGFQFLRQIKEDEALRTMPFIFYSATYRADKDVDLALALGAEAYIIKPKDPEELWEEVEIILQNREKEKIITPELIKEDDEYLKRYSQVVATKLEEKVRELEESLVLREKAEKEIYFLASVIRNVPEAVCAIDSAGNIIFWNEGAVKMLGYTAEEIIGSPITMTIPEDLALEELEHCIGILNTEGSFENYETLRLAKDGRIIPVEITAVATKDGSGNITGYTSMIRDITERKLAERELRDRVEELEKFYDMAVGRELRMKELKKEMEQLRDEISAYKKVT